MGKRRRGRTKWNTGRNTKHSHREQWNQGVMQGLTEAKTPGISTEVQEMKKRMEDLIWRQGKEREEK